MEYPKINSLWKRADDHSFIVGEHSCEEFASINKWRVEEKIDGTNIVVSYTDNKPSFRGRTKDSMIPAHLLSYLEGHFTADRLAKVFPENKHMLLYGEGYGHKIQTGDFYRTDVGFMLFDVIVDRWWLTRESVKEMGEQLELPVPPDLGVMKEDEIIEFVKSKPQSRCSIKPQVLEGIIARSEPVMLFRNGRPIIWKLKVRDFECKS